MGSPSVQQQQRENEKMSKENDNFSDAETERRRDEVIRRMANTPPQPKATIPHRPTKKKKKAVAGHAVRKARAHREA
jgi:hypothetical protein